MLEDGDATWDGRGSSGGVCYYDVIQFVVSAAGPYTFTNFYPGDVPTDMNLDGFLRLFANVFNRLDPGSFIAFDDDYSGPEFGGACLWLRQLMGGLKPAHPLPASKRFVDWIAHHAKFPNRRPATPRAVHQQPATCRARSESVGRSR